MKISIHMPAFNAEATIASALKSLLRQGDAGELEIIVVDDGSTDRTCEVVSTLAATAPEIRLIRVPHRGISKARNVALRAMAPDAELIGFLDADDLSPAGRYARDVAMLEADPTIQIIMSKVCFFDREDAQELAPSIDSHTVEGRIVHLGATLLRRGLLDGLELFDEALLQSEDLDLVLRILEKRPKHVLSDQIGVFYRKNHGSITENRRQFRQELMKALFRARRRQPGGTFALPEGLFTPNHMPELRTWVK